MKLLGIADLTERVGDDQASEAVGLVLVVCPVGPVIAAELWGRVHGDDFWGRVVFRVEVLRIGTLAFLLVG